MSFNLTMQQQQLTYQRQLDLCLFLLECQRQLDWFRRQPRMLHAEQHILATVQAPGPPALAQQSSGQSICRKPFTCEKLADSSKSLISACKSRESPQGACAGACIVSSHNPNSARVRLANGFSSSFKQDDHAIALVAVQQSDVCAVCSSFWCVCLCRLCDCSGRNFQETLVVAPQVSPQ